MNKATAYVDGSYRDDLKRFSFGCVIFYDNKQKEFCEASDNPVLVDMRNVAGEITGAMFAMEFCRLNNIEELDLYYDYQGIEAWATGSWKRNRFGTQRYKNFYDDCSKSVKVNFYKVKGHTGVEYNELADRLAKKALGIKK